MEWPVMIDSLNLIEVTAVPITLLIDQSGVIRFKNPKDAELDQFLATEYPNSPAPEPVTWPQELANAVAAVNSGGPSEISAAHEAYENIAEKSPRQWFQYGVLSRKRFDSPDAETDDFADAVTAWSKALAGEPRQYIWRRRIQQYGPRLDKPYPFYDWIPEARESIAGRGEEPIQLVTEPSGAEFAVPGEVASSQSEKPHPDPQKQLPDDQKGLVSVTTVAVPSTDAKKPGWRIHLTFTPNPTLDAHWNNENGPMKVWLDSSDSWEPVDKFMHREVATAPENLKSATSTEARHLEFEILPAAKETVPEKVSGNAYIYICEGATGTCMYLRKSFTVKVSNDTE